MVEIIRYKWLQKIKLNWHESFYASLNKLLEKDVFGSDLGTAKEYKAPKIVEPDAILKFLTACSIDFYRENVEKELERYI